MANAKAVVAANRDRPEPFTVAKDRPRPWVRCDFDIIPNLLTGVQAAKNSAVMVAVNSKFMQHKLTPRKTAATALFKS